MQFFFPHYHYHQIYHIFPPLIILLVGTEITQPSNQSVFCLVMFDLSITIASCWRLHLLAGMGGGQRCVVLTEAQRWCSPPLTSPQCTSVTPTSWPLTPNHKDNGVVQQKKMLDSQVPKSPVLIQTPRSTRRGKSSAQHQ